MIRASADVLPNSSLPRRVTLLGVRAVHTAIFALELVCIGWLVQTGATGRRDRSVALAAGFVGAEVVVFIGNRGVCPLTPLAEQLGAEQGSVSDLFMPDVVARTLPLWASGLLALAAALHVRAAWRAHQAAPPRTSPALVPGLAANRVTNRRLDPGDVDSH